MRDTLKIVLLKTIKSVRTLNLDELSYFLFIYLGNIGREAEEHYTRKRAAQITLSSIIYGQTIDKNSDNNSITEKVSLIDREELLQDFGDLIFDRLERLVQESSSVVVNENDQKIQAKNFVIFLRTLEYCNRLPASAKFTKAFEDFLEQNFQKFTPSEVLTLAQLCSQTKVCENLFYKLFTTVYVPEYYKDMNFEESVEFIKMSHQNKLDGTLLFFRLEALTNSATLAQLAQSLLLLMNINHSVQQKSSTLSQLITKTLAAIGRRLNLEKAEMLPTVKQLLKLLVAAHVYDEVEICTDVLTALSKKIILNSSEDFLTAINFIEFCGKENAQLADIAAQCRFHLEQKYLPEKKNQL